MSVERRPPGDPFRSFCAGCDRETECYHVEAARAIWCLECWRRWVEQNDPAGAA